VPSLLNSALAPGTVAKIAPKISSRRVGSGTGDIEKYSSIYSLFPLWEAYESNSQKQAESKYPAAYFFMYN